MDTRKYIRQFRKTLSGNDLEYCVCRSDHCQQYYYFRLLMGYLFALQPSVTLGGLF